MCKPKETVVNNRIVKKLNNQYAKSNVGCLSSNANISDKTSTAIMNVFNSLLILIHL